MNSEMDRRIHDYLDGRLAEDEKVEFEKQIAHDAELSERIEEYGRIRSALGEETEELSPGFYTRTRAEFESRRTSARRGFRIFSWETAGLALATGLAVVVFVPGLLRDGSTLLPTEVQSDAVTPSSTFDDAPAESFERKLPEKVFAEPPADRLKQKSDLDESSTASPAAAAPEADEEPDWAGKKRSEKEELQFAPLEQPPAPTTRNEARAAGERARSFGLTDVTAEGSIEESGVDAWVLPGGAVAPGEIRVTSRDEIVMGAEDIKDAESFREDKGSSQRSGSLSKSENLPEAGRRNLLIGPRDRPFSCVGILVRRVGDVWVITLSDPSADRPASETGCGVALPDDGMGFLVEGPAR